MTNLEKRDKYASLMSKLKKATDNEYYYEAIFLEYAILEDRTESLLRHAGKKYQENNGQSFKLSKKLNKFISEEEFKTTYVKKHLTEELINNIYNWKEKRDKLMHDMVNLQYGNDEVKNIALEGECLVIHLNNKTKLINNHFDKLKMIK